MYVYVRVSLFDRKTARLFIGVALMRNKVLWNGAIFFVRQKRCTKTGMNMNSYAAFKELICSHFFFFVSPILCFIVERKLCDSLAMRRLPQEKKKSWLTSNVCFHCSVVDYELTLGT